MELCDLDGDGIKEILLKLTYEISTNDRYTGDMVLFRKGDKGYEPILTPEELQLRAEDDEIGYPSNYQPATPGIVLRYEVLEEAKIRITVRGLGDKIKQDVLMNKELWWSYVDIYTGMEHCSVCYDTVILEQGEKDILEFHFEALNQWYPDEVVIITEYENGELHVADCWYVGRE